MKLKALTSGTVLLALLAVGCQEESPPGGPGAGGEGEAAEKDTFVLQTPAMHPSIQPGEQQEVTVSLDRGEAFEQMVTLAFEPPAGVTVSPETVDIPAGETETKVTVSADASAKPGEQAIKVTATPETGAAVSHDLVVDIGEKEQEGAQEKEPQEGTQRDTTAPPANPGEAPQP